MSPGWFDHVLAAILVVAVPFEGAMTLRRLAASVARGVPTARLREYALTMAIQWGLVGVVVVNWLLADRSLAALGLTVPGGGRTLAGLFVTVLVLAFLVLQWRAIQRLDAEALARIGGQFGDATPLLPRTARESTGFRMLSITAGVCEEILYRGFLIWYFGSWVGPWPGALIASVGFGLAHAYQGRKGVLKTGFYGLLMAVLYLATGSLLWPMILHAAIDLQGGAVGRRALGGTAPVPVPQSAA